MADIRTTTKVEGPDASDAAITQNPILQGGRASDAAVTAVSADGDIVAAWLTRRGATIVAPLDHIGLDGVPYSLTSKSLQITSSGSSDMWTPAGGKKIVVTSYQLQCTGSASGDAVLWFGASGDNTYTRGTDLAMFDGAFAPTATFWPGALQTGLWIASAVDHRVKLYAGVTFNLTATVWGYEI